MIADPQPLSSFVALSIPPAGMPLETARIEQLQVRIPGVIGLHVDGDRRRIHVLYDGRQSTLAAIVKALHRLGYEARAPDYVWRTRRITRVGRDKIPDHRGSRPCRTVGALWASKTR